jgi:iron complex outermembrane receptor protein
MNRTALFLGLMAASGLAQAMSGLVTDVRGKPVKGAKIEIVGTQSSTRTDAKGNFQLDADASGEEIHITAPGYNHTTVQLDKQGVESVRVVLRRSAIEQVDVTATPLHTSIMESAVPVNVVAGEELRRKQAATLGETLKNEVGVHSSYFGPVASTPIIRGLNGPRVLITQNSLDVSDASRVGPDHVVATETAVAEQIEILRGPATLFFGSGAIGGVVNVVDNRVPTSSESKGAFTVGHNTVADEDEASFAFTGGNEDFAFHVDGFWRDGSDYEIPGVAELESEHHHEEDHDDDHEEHGEEQRSGVLENSASESKGFNIGGSWLLDNGYVGISYGRLERINGIPGHSHAHEDEHEHEEDHEDEHEGEEHGEEAVMSDLEQDRWQLISELSLDGDWLSGINLRMGYTDYEHAEIENGETGTVFKNETAQVRMDLMLKEWAGWHGAISLEAKTTDFEAVGEEAFTPPSKTDSYAIAFMQEKHIDDFLWQLGARVERVSIEADPIPWEDLHEEEHDEHDHEEDGDHSEEELLNFDSVDFTPFSLSAGVVWSYAEDYNVGLSLTHAQRAPSAAELFSYGPHIGTGTYEVGAVFELHGGDEPHFDYSNDVDEETSTNVDLTFRKHSGDVGWVVNLFYNQVDNFYYERDTGLSSDVFTEHDHDEDHDEDHGEEHSEGETPVFVFEQADATLYGLEAQLAWQINSPLKLSVWGDTIRGELDDGGDLPRIPPARVGSELRFEQGGWQSEIGFTHYFEQDKVAEEETSTDSYTLVDAQVSYTFSNGDDTDITLYLKGTNLTDEEARVHSSFLKDRAPLPGRGFSVGLRGSF